MSVLLAPLIIILSSDASARDAPPRDGAERSRSLSRHTSPPVQCHTAEECFSLAERTIDEGTSDDLAERTRRGVELYRRACELGAAPACGVAGAMFENGYLGYIVKDGKAAQTMLEKGCSLRDVRVCHRLGYLYEKGSSDGMVKPNFPKAIALYKKNCAANRAQSCLRLSEMYGEGRGVKKNKTLAEKYMERAEELGLSPP